MYINGWNKKTRYNFPLRPGNAIENLNVKKKYYKKSFDSRAQTRRQRKSEKKRIRQRVKSHRSLYSSSSRLNYLSKIKHV